LNAFFRLGLIAVSVALLVMAIAAHAAPPRHGAPPTPAAPASKQAARCAEHGVPKPLCTRCNPKLAAVYQAKRDWCAEHDRPESQCVLCHPALAKEGVK
jgi:hypothetical protein